MLTFIRVALTYTMTPSRGHVTIRFPAGVADDDDTAALYVRLRDGDFWRRVIVFATEWRRCEAAYSCENHNTEQLVNQLTKSSIALNNFQLNRIKYTFK